ncbi:MAG: VOC family protein [Crocinitomicaceae bacterium]
MNKKAGFIAAFVAAFVGGFVASKFGKSDKEKVAIVETIDTTSPNLKTVPKAEIMIDSNVKLGAFSMSLSVKNLQVSREFYEKLGFKDHGGNAEMGYLIMKNENALIGLFQGMFDGNILTFNPGWDEMTNEIESFDDVRVIQSKLKDKGIELMTEAPDSTKGPASIMLTDPDGNVILIDQHR